jgi:hypothetical protein
MTNGVQAVARTLHKLARDGGGRLRRELMASAQPRGIVSDFIDLLPQAQRIRLPSDSSFGPLNEREPVAPALFPKERRGPFEHLSCQAGMAVASGASSPGRPLALRRETYAWPRISAVVSAGRDQCWTSIVR